MAINQDKKQTVQARETKKLLTRLTSAHADIQNHHATHTAIDHRIDSDLTLINNNVSCLVNEVWSRDKKTGRDRRRAQTSQGANFVFGEQIGVSWDFRGEIKSQRQHLLLRNLTHNGFILYACRGRRFQVQRNVGNVEQLHARPQAGQETRS